MRQNRNRLWVLGASDPEMELIERLLRESGESVVYATGEDGRRVHPGNAYRCPAPEVPAGATVYAVECVDVLPEGWIRIDHHRPGDPGYGRPPEAFLPASSIGQVIAELARLGLLGWPQAAWTGAVWYTAPCYVLAAASAARVAHHEWVVADRRYVPSVYILAAAADHCLAAAYRGECPGVDPDALMRWRIKTRAAFQGRTVEEVLADVEQARELLEDAPNERLAHGVYVADMRGYGHVPELPEAAVRDGVAYLAVVTDRDGRRKVVLGGHTTPETVRAFLTDWAPAHGLVDIYGDPARGFAGGYLPQHAEEAATA